jgi:hypothetical protein
MKRYANWKGSLNDFLEVGDLVDEEMMEYFINVLPPETFTSSCIQIGEPYSFVAGAETYSTLKWTYDGWMYCGNCHSGRTEEPY